jgi:hypothetical protein
MPRTTVVAKDSHLVSLPPTELENLQPAILALVDANVAASPVVRAVVCAH